MQKIVFFFILYLLIFAISFHCFNVPASIDKNSIVGDSCTTSLLPEGMPDSSFLESMRKKEQELTTWERGEHDRDSE